MIFMIASKYYGINLLDPATARKCAECGVFTHAWEDIGDTKKKIDADISWTRDGFPLVSEKVKAIVEYKATSQADFIPLSNGLYAFRQRKKVFVDVSDALERTKGPCQKCGRFTAFLGDIDLVKPLAGQVTIGMDDIVRTHQLWGGDVDFFFLILIGEALASALKHEGLKGSITWVPMEQFPS